MSHIQVRMVYAWPERLFERFEDGRTRLVRDPQSPIRPARPWEFHVGWWQEMSSGEIAQLVSSYKGQVLFQHDGFETWQN